MQIFTLHAGVTKACGEVATCCFVFAFLSGVRSSAGRSPTPFPLSLSDFLPPLLLSFPGVFSHAVQPADEELPG